MSSLLYIFGILCAVWVIYDVWATQKSMETVHKVLWTVGAVFFNIITAIIYYFVKKK